MKILIAASTWPEIAPFERLLALDRTTNFLKIYRLHKAEIHVLMTGVGMTATAVSASAAFAREKYDHAINPGIAGAFDRELQLGEVVRVNKDRIPELGAEDGDTFLSVHQLDLHGESQAPYDHAWIHDSGDAFPAFASLKTCTGITVNTALGNDDSIARMIRSFSPQVESMEGAAFLSAAKYANVPAIQIRSISNYVERRDKSKWNIPLAIDNLSEVLYSGVEAMSK